jgi:energy-coupling factor transporter transmembrane protein EcfT
MGTIDTLCPPALIFLVFSIIQILIDIFKAYYNQAFFKFIYMIIFTLLLNVLCKKGLGIISWFLVFIPFILMTFISVILVMVFGINPAQGDYTVDVEDGNGNNIDDDDEDDDEDNNTNGSSSTSSNGSSTSTSNNGSSSSTNSNGNSQSESIVVDPRTNKRIYVTNNINNNNNNNNNINNKNNNNEDNKEGLLNYSVYNSSTNSRHRGYSKKDKQEPPKLETTSIDTFYKNMFKKLI